MAIWGCSSPAHCCQPAVAGGFIYADLRSELNTHLALRLCLLRVLLGASHCYKLSPFQAHWGKWHCTSFLRPACLFTVHVGSESSPLSCGVFSHRYFYKLSYSWLLDVCCCSCLLQLACCEGFPSPPLGAQGTPPSLLHVFVVVCAYYPFFFLFSLGWGQSVQGAMPIWPRVLCGSTVYHLAHLVVRIFPSGLGAGVWQPGGPPGFSI
jgi:hypothetical protein